MTDLHTHILPGIDDGAKTIEESISLLQAEVSDSVTTVALTPHFNLSSAEQPEFLEQRAKAFRILNKAVHKHKLPVNLILGAEVAFSTELLDYDLDSLCFEGTKTLLIELPLLQYHSFTHEIFYRLQLNGYTPLIAHAERYSYLIRDTDLLEKLVRSGTQVQINAGAMLRMGRTRRKLLKMISADLIHVIATDTHSVSMRPPRLASAVKVVEKKLGTETAKRLVNFEK